MKIITTFFFCAVVLCKLFMVLDAISTSHVDINLLESITKAITHPHNKKFYAFVCWNETGIKKIELICDLSMEGNIYLSCVMF